MLLLLNSYKILLIQAISSELLWEHWLMLVLWKTLYKWLLLFSTVVFCSVLRLVAGGRWSPGGGCGWCRRWGSSPPGPAPARREPWAGQHSAGIQMFNLFIAWHGTNFPGIFHHKKNHFSIHIWHLLWSVAVPGEEVGEGVVDREGLTVALQPHHTAARVAASRGQGETEDSNGECFYSLLLIMAGLSVCINITSPYTRFVVSTARSERRAGEESAAMFH